MGKPTRIRMPEHHAPDCNGGRNYPLECDCRKRVAIQRLFDAFERDDIELAVDLLIERLDACDGDPDLEDPEGIGAIDGEGNFLWRDSYPAGAYEDGEPCDDDCGAEELGELTSIECHDYQGSAIPAFADDRDEPDGASIRMPHRDRIRREQCVTETIQGYGWSRTTFVLKAPAGDRVSA